MTDERIKIQKIDDYRWRIPREGKMRTDGVIYADERLFNDIRKDQSLAQVANVAWLPGIVSHSLAMPDIHWGYGFPIGGVAGFDMDARVLRVVSGVAPETFCPGKLSSLILHPAMASAPWQFGGTPN